MKFEVRETVHTPDREMVLRALEMCSREICSDVMRFGDRITVHGLGPSPRARNRNDMTVFCVNAEQDKTIIEGEVNFQASALLGDTSQQDVVKSKIDGLFEQMKAQINLDTLRVEAYAGARSSAALTAAAGSTAGEDRSEEKDFATEQMQVPIERVAPVRAHETLVEASEAAPESGWAALVGERRLDTTQEAIPEQRQIEVLIDEALSEHLLPPEIVYAPYRTFEVVQLEKAAGGGKEVASEQAGQPRPVAAPMAPELKWVATPKFSAPFEREDETIHRWRRPGLWALALIAFVLVAAGIYFFYWSGRAITVPSALTAVPSNEAATTSQAAVPEESVEPPLQSKAAIPQSVASAPAAADPDAVPNLRLWLERWAAAMRTRDANAQAGFYADTLDQYLKQRNVGRAAVLRDREATLRMRRGLWTVKMEDVVVERQNGSEAHVRLVKHFIDEPEQSEILESFVPIRLTVKRLNGVWKITSEQDLPAMVVTPLKTNRKLSVPR